MPLHTYWCKACGNKEEKLLSHKDAEKLLRCPKCRAWMVRQLGSIAHFEFKGNLKRI